MADALLTSIIEGLNQRISDLTAENMALQQTVTAILASIPAEQASHVKRHVEEINDFVLKGGSNAAVELVEAQKPVYERLFLHVR